MMEEFELKLNQQDLELIAQLIDAGVKAQGLSVLKQAAYIIQKLEAATPIEMEEENGTEEITS